MLKPVRIVPSDASEQFASRLAHELEHTFQFILMGRKVSVAPFEAFCMPIDTYLAKFRKKSVMLKIDLEDLPDDKFYAFFEFNTAIIMGGIMRQMQDSMIQEQVKAQSFPQPVSDAFGEIGNQFNGTLDRVLREAAKSSVHLILDFNRKVYPDEQIALSQFRTTEEYIVWISTITLKDFGSHKLTFLIPQTMYEKVIGQPVSLQGITPSKIALYTWDEYLFNSLRQNVESRYFVVERAEHPGDIIHLSKEPNCCAIAIDLSRLADPVPHDVKILVKRIQAAKIPETIPVWVSLANPSASLCKQLEALGLRGVTNASARKSLEPWLQVHLKKILDKHEK